MDLLRHKAYFAYIFLESKRFLIMCQILKFEGFVEKKSR